MKILYVGLFLVAFCFGKTYPQACHLRELDLCAATLLVFTNNDEDCTGSEEEIERQCGFIREAEDCHDNYTDKCATEGQKDLVDFLGTGSKKISDEFCVNGTKLRRDYKVHARCISDARKGNGKRCVRDLRAALEVISDTHWDQRIATSCCAFNRFDDCMMDSVKDKCGPDARRVTKKLIRLAVSKLPEIICKAYKSTSKRCVSSLPPPGTIAKGGKSQSLLSKVFATYVNNQD